MGRLALAKKPEQPGLLKRPNTSALGLLFILTHSVTDAKQACGENHESKVEGFMSFGGQCRTRHSS